MKNLKFGLCQGRHNIPQVEEYIFPMDIENPLDFDALYKHASNILKSVSSTDTLNLYVTGLTTDLLAVIEVCIEKKCILNLYHFNRDTGAYEVRTMDFLGDY